MSSLLTKQNKIAVLCVGVLSLGLIPTAGASLESRLGGLAVYDTDFDITWLANANAGAGSSFDDSDGGFNTSADGRMTWQNANNWAASLNVGGVTDWRLPTALNSDGTSPCFVINCTDSEMGHLFHNELGGTAGNSILSSTDPDLELFSNVQSVYWSSTVWSRPEEATVDPEEQAWDFFFEDGEQFINPTSGFLHAWAVHSGDVEGLSAPEPGATPDTPLLPDTTVIDPDTALPIFGFDVTAGSGMVFIDPDVATGYEFTTDLLNFTSVLIPTALPNGDAEFLLDLGLAGEFTLFAGATFDLTSIQAGGFANLTITGINTNELLDPSDPFAFVSGFTFDGTGSTAVTMTPITTFVTAPMPLALLGLGLLGMVVVRRNTV